MLLGKISFRPLWGEKVPKVGGVKKEDGLKKMETSHFLCGRL